MKSGIRIPDVRREVERSRAQLRSDHRRAAVIATDRASREGVIALRQKMRAVGLGKLGNAVGQTSTLRKRQASNRGDDPYGVWFARGGDDSLAGGALESYSRGATIMPKAGKRWLWFPTAAIQRRVKIGDKRFRLTPARWIGSSLEQTVGKLEFRPLGPNRAVLVVKNVTLSPKTGQAKARGPRAPRTRIPVKEVVAFVGIPFTRRTQRFDKDQVALVYSRRVPDYIAEALADITGRAR